MGLRTANAAHFKRFKELLGLMSLWIQFVSSLSVFLSLAHTLPYGIIGNEPKNRQLMGQTCAVNYFHLTGY